MFINYEHENNVYSLTIERREDNYFVTYDNTESVSYTHLTLPTN